MIIADTNIISYLLLPTPYSDSADILYSSDFQYPIFYLIDPAKSQNMFALKNGQENPHSMGKPTTLAHALYFSKYRVDV